MTPFKIIIGCVLFDMLQLCIWIARMQACNFACSERNPRKPTEAGAAGFTSSADVPDSMNAEFSSSPQSS